MNGILEYVKNAFHGLASDVNTANVAERVHRKDKHEWRNDSFYLKLWSNAHWLTIGTDVFYVI